MPEYEHLCENQECQHEWEAEYSIKADPPTHCPKCNQATAKRLISGGSGKGIVELTGQELKDHLKNEAKREVRQVNENKYANWVGESKYSASRTAYDRVMSDVRKIRR